MTTLLGTYSNPGGVVLAKGSIHFRLSRSATFTAGGGGPRKINPWEEQVYRITNGVISGPGNGPYTIYGLDVLRPVGLFYEITILSNDQRVIDQFQTAAIVGSSVDIGNIAIVPPGGLVGNLDGDVEGPESNTTVVGIRNQPVTTDDPAEGDVLIFNGTMYERSQDADLLLVGTDSSYDPGITIDAGAKHITVVGDNAHSFVDVGVATDSSSATIQSAPGNTVDAQVTLQADASEGAITVTNLAAAKRFRTSLTEAITRIEGMSLLMATAPGGTTTVNVDATTGNAEFANASGDARFQINASTDDVTLKDADLIVKDGVADALKYDASARAFTSKVSASATVFPKRVATEVDTIGVNATPFDMTYAAGWALFDSAAGNWVLNSAAVPDDTEPYDVWLWNQSGHTMTVKHHSGTFPPGNILFDCPGGVDLVVPDGGMAIGKYFPGAYIYIRITS